MSLIPTPYTVAHISRGVDTNQKDAHGNFVKVAATPVLRKVQSFVQASSGQHYSIETVERDENEIQMAVPNPQVYKSGDQVLIFGTVVNGTYTNGTAYVVDGDASDSRLGPWARHVRQFGGIVKLKRVT